jgi:UDPglucose 6-dehydrogenase
MHVAMIGTGYVGLVSGACFADFGHQVTCIDKDADKIASLARGDVPIFEPGLAELVKTNLHQGRLVFSTELASAVREADAVFIAVGTPSRPGDGNVDISFVYAAAREIAAALDGFTLVITKSTVPVGTCDEVERIIRQVRPDADFEVVANPEFLREGAAIRDFKLPDRIVVGTGDARARERMAELYRPLYLNAPPLLYTDRRTAELIKYAANAFLAMKITFINEIADLCEAVGADVQEVAHCNTRASPGRGAAHARLAAQSRFCWSLPRGRLSMCVPADPYRLYCSRGAPPGRRELAFREGYHRGRLPRYLDGPAQLGRPGAVEA